MALTSITAATQQAVALYRLIILPNGQAKIREMLSANEAGSMGVVRARHSQLYIWQVPLMLLDSSVYLFIAGLRLLLWNATKKRQYQWSAEETKVSEHS